jgi:siroheme synthase
VTHRGLARTLTIASGHDDPHSPAARARWEALATVPGTLVLLMSMGRLGEIAEALIAGGRPADEPAAAIQWATTPSEATVSATLATLDDACRTAGIGNPAVVVIGSVVAIGDLIASGALAAEHHLPGDPGLEDVAIGVEDDRII